MRTFWRRDKLMTCLETSRVTFFETDFSGSGSHTLVFRRCHADNDPENLTDPSGEFVGPVIAAIGVVGAVVGGIVEGHKDYKCHHARGMALAKSVGRGALSGVAGAFAGIGFGFVTDSPFLGGAIGSAVYDGFNGFFAGGFNGPSVAKHALVAGAVSSGAAIVAGALVPVVGGANFNPLLSPRWYGPMARQTYFAEFIGRTIDAGKDAGNGSGGDCECKE